MAPPQRSLPLHLRLLRVIIERSPWQFLGAQVVNFHARYPALIDSVHNGPSARSSLYAKSPDVAKQKRTLAPSFSLRSLRSLAANHLHPALQLAPCSPGRFLRPLDRAPSLHLPAPIFLPPHPSHPSYVSDRS